MCTDIVCKVPYFNTPVYLENMEVIGKLEDIFGVFNDYVSVCGVMYTETCPPCCFNHELMKYLSTVVFHQAVHWDESRIIQGWHKHVCCLEQGAPHVSVYFRYVGLLFFFLFGDCSSLTGFVPQSPQSVDEEGHVEVAVAAVAEVDVVDAEDAVAVEVVVAALAGAEAEDLVALAASVGLVEVAVGVVASVDGVGVIKTLCFFPSPPTANLPLVLPPPCIDV